MTYAATLHNPAQAVTTWNGIFPKVKSYLMAGHRLELVIKKQKRTTPQNAKLWATLTDIAEQVVWHGEKLTPTDWKVMLTAGLRKQRAVVGIDGGFVVLGESTSRMTVEEMGELLELAMAFGAQNGVIFNDKN